MKPLPLLILLAHLISASVHPQVPINGTVNGKTMYGVDEYKNVLSKYFDELGFREKYSENEINNVLGMYYSDQPYAACALKVQRYYVLREVLEKNKNYAPDIDALYKQLNTSLGENPSLAKLLMPKFDEQAYSKSLTENKYIVSDYWVDMRNEALTKCQNLYQTFEKSLPQCRSLFMAELEKSRKMEGGNDFIGTWEGNTGYGTLTVTVKGSGNGISAKTAHVKNNGFTDKGEWNNCQLSGNTLKCLWYEDYEDGDKKIHRMGFNSITLTGDQLQISSEDDEPNFTWKPNITPYSSGIRKGATWSASIKRKLK